ncbi:MAG: adenylate/guanylate cyclase domain-containing protein [Gammaproteobacteria bacterium]
MIYPETLYARSKEGNVAYQLVGDGPLDLVVIPSWLNNIDAMWDEPSLAHFLRRLATFSRLLCFDKRGAGVSDTVSLAELPTLEQWSDDVRTVMDAAGSKRAALLGLGAGAQMAMLFAATYPEQTSSLILVNSSARRLRDVDYPWGLPEERLPLRLERIEELWGNGGNLDFIAPGVAHDRDFRRRYARFERLAMGPRAARAILAAGWQSDLRGVLSAIQVPTLVLHRSGDRFIRVEQGRFVAEHIPGAKFVELPGEDHLFYAGETEPMIAEIHEFLTGTRTVREIDRVLATVVFTDIVGSTERAANLGDRAWRELIGLHNDITRRELARYRGREVRFTGDGFLITFDGPARAIHSANAIARAVHSLGIDIRAGLHTGEIQFTDNDVAGIAVHIGARVLAKAGAGEIVVSSTVKDLVAGSGIQFIDRGVHLFNGVPGQWHLYTAA